MNLTAGPVTTENVRNVCILAHVDHGKTSLADSLLSLNGLVNKRNIGSVRFLDDREDEQLRGITMKSSAVLITDVLTEEDGFSKPISVVLNLIDTPGHIDFSTEVTAAVRICDGALIVVDVVEGICAQTKESIKYAYDEKLKMILVINKIDRLILDLKQGPKEMFNSILMIIEECNAYVTTLHFRDMAVNSDLGTNDKIESVFAPETGNVIFSSAIDGWGFTLRHIAKMYIAVLPNETEDTLNSKLWNFDCYVNSKEKQIKYGAILANKANLFIQLVTSTIHHVYNTIIINQDISSIDSIIKNLKLNNYPPLSQQSDYRTKVRVILGTWKPLSKVLFQQCYIILPSPCQLTDERIRYLISNGRFENCIELSNFIENNKKALKKCSTDGPTVAYVSKNLAINKNLLFGNSQTVHPHSRLEPRVNDEGVKIIALIRIFSGKVYVGQELHLINSTFDLAEYNLTDNKDMYLENHNVRKITVESLYILLGREYCPVKHVSAGYICGLASSEDIVYRNGTLCSSLYTTPLVEQLTLEPIVCNVISPVEATQMTQLKEALLKLQQSDSCVRVLLNETGEYQLLTAGDVHLEKCLEDLKNNFTHVEFTVSPPIYSLRETIDFNNDSDNVVTSCITTDSCNVTVEVSVLPLPYKIKRVVMAHSSLLKTIQETEVSTGLADIWMRHNKDESSTRPSVDKSFKDESINASVIRLKLLLKEAFSQCSTKWKNISVENLWQISSFKNVNLLINGVSNYTCNIFVTPNECDTRVFLEKYIAKAFNMCCLAGPLCEEPLMNCMFIIHDFQVSGCIDSSSLSSAEQASQLINGLHSCFRNTLLKQNPSIMEPILATNIQTDAQALGKIYSEVHRRYGKIIEALDLNEERKVFIVKAQIPAVDSKGFASVIRKISSGCANPSLQFSHYEIVYANLLKSGASEDSDEDVDAVDRANRLINMVRRRKGLSVINEQVVIHAEKQRTLKK